MVLNLFYPTQYCVMMMMMMIYLRSRERWTWLPDSSLPPSQEPELTLLSPMEVAGAQPVEPSLQPSRVFLVEKPEAGNKY